LDVAPEFFSKVWDEHQTDDTWNAWVCIEDDGKAKVVGFIVLQVFVHDSTYFAWCAYFPAVPASMRSSMLVFFADIFGCWPNTGAHRSTSAQPSPTQ
jgi:hypothetical protein